MAWCARIATLCVLIVPLVAGGVCLADGLDDVRRSGVLRHLGVPYAGFVMGPEAGLDVDLVRRFAEHLGVRYSFVQADWSVLFPWLTGRRFRVLGDRVEDLGPEEVRGDLAACGITVLAWRKELADFSRPTFPTQVWLVARSESTLKPITPSGDTAADLPMLRAALARTPDVQALFVTRSAPLADEVRSLCPEAVCVGAPATLMAILNGLAGR